MSDGRRGFFRRLFAGAGVAAATQTTVQAQPAASNAAGTSPTYLPAYARAQNYRSLKQSSYDRTGGNRDFWNIAPGATLEIFKEDQPGVITHIWFTIAAQTTYHLKELVLRAFWDGNSKPSVEAPIGDFFGLNLGSYQIYESEYLACSPGRSLNCYFAMPYRSARLTVTNEGKAEVRAFYSNIDYQTVSALPQDSLYFHAQYRQNAPNVATTGDDSKTNPTGRLNHVYAESRGRGHLMGVTIGILQNAEGWWGEGDDMTFIDDETKPLIIGTGSEDYLLGSWNFGGRDGAREFAHRQYGAHQISSPERPGGRYLCYRWHGDNPITFTRYMKHTMEHGHSNDRGDNFYSVCYWYQAQPYTDFPALPPVDQRIPRVRQPNA
jgi:hypothetical protein